MIATHKIDRHLFLQQVRVVHQVQLYLQVVRKELGGTRAVGEYAPDPGGRDDYHMGPYPRHEAERLTAIA